MTPTAACGDRSLNSRGFAAHRKTKGGPMCGRFSIPSTPAELRAFFRYGETPNFPPRYNIAPTQPIPLIHAARDGAGGQRRVFLLARWGLWPSFVKDVREFPLLFNARSETAAEKASFRNAMKRRRCLIPADAYYEWRREPGAGKGARGRPYLFRRADGQPLGLAGLWETWHGADGSEVDTACILTTDANAATVAIHDRMPAILEPAQFDAWLDPDQENGDIAARLLRPAPVSTLEFFEIGAAVNRVANDDAALQKPITALFSD
jgi:putative SOS response-associated peptidase YedK